MKVVLATSPHVRHPAVLASDFRIDPSVMYSFAPVGLLSLVAVLREKNDVDISLFDLNESIRNQAISIRGAFYENAARYIVSQSPDVLGFMTECDSYHHVLQIVEAIKALDGRIRIVLGGPHATAVAAETMAYTGAVDAIVLGEGETSFPDLIKLWQADEAGEVPAGCIVRFSDGTIKQGERTRLVDRLDELPIPAYELYPAQKGEEIFVEAGRGCPFQCTFCSTAPFWQRKHRVKSPGRILSEIAVVQALFESKRVHFTHDLLTADRQWLQAVCRCLVDAGTPVQWTCSARTDTVDRKLLELMARAGCNAIYFGIESGSDRILKEVRKDLSVDTSLDVLKMCKELGITPNTGFIVGFPTEDEASLDATFEAFEKALRLGARPTHIFTFCPFAQSSGFKDLHDLATDNHYLDLPLEPDLEERNRNLIAQHGEIFGGYFRPRSSVATFLRGADEFSSLVDAVMMPVLALSETCGGMKEIYRRWTAWIESYNVNRKAAAHRLRYGTPAQFCEFVVQELTETEAVPQFVKELAQVLRISLVLASQAASAEPTSMAGFRRLNRIAKVEPLRMEDSVRLSDVIATLRVEHDLRDYLSGDVTISRTPEIRPVNFVWHRKADGTNICLSEVSDFVFFALQRLKVGPKSTAALLLDWMDDGAGAEAALVDWGESLDELSQAQSLGMVECYD